MTTLTPTMYNGVYPAKVYSNSDPNQMKRIQMYIPQIFQNQPVLIWAPPMFAGGAVPKPGDIVWMQFQGGDTSYPVYMPPVQAYHPPQTPPATGLNTFTDAGGEVWVSRIGSPWKKARDVACCRLYSNGANQNIPTGVGTIINLNVAQYDPLLYITANGYWTPIAGRYQIIANIHAFGSPGASGGQMQAIIAVNGTSASYGNSISWPVGGQSWPAANAADVLKLNPNDVVQMIGWQTCGVALPIMANDITRTFLTIHYLDPG